MTTDPPEPITLVFLGHASPADADGAAQVVETDTIVAASPPR